MRFGTLPIDSLKGRLDPNSCMTHSDGDLQRLVGVCINLEQLMPVLVNERNGRLVWGEELVEALDAAGIEDVAVAYVDLDETQHGLAAVALRASYGKFDNAKLTKQLQAWDAHGIDVDESGLQPWRIERLLGRTVPVQRGVKNCPKCGEQL